MDRLNYASFVERFKEGMSVKQNDPILAEYLLGSIYKTVHVFRRQFKKSVAPELYDDITAREASRFLNQLDNIPVALVAAASDQRVINNAPSYFKKTIVPLLDSDLQLKMFSKLYNLIKTADNIDNKTRARFMELAENIKDPDQKAEYLAAVFLYAVKQENKLTKENGGSKKQSKDILYTKLLDNFIYTRDQHPSILMMKPDPYLFPKGLPSISNTERTVVKGEDQPLSIKEMVQESWKKNKHLLLIGEGGIGKTVVMLTLPEEDWFRQYKIPTIYVPLQRLDLKEGKLDDYLNARFEDDVRDKIIELSNRIPKGHPELILLLDGFNEIPDKYKGTAEKAIMDWMERPGIQIITTSRMGFSIEKKYLKYDLQPLPKKTIKSFLLSSGLEELKLPRETDQIWKVINIPLMLSLYTQIEKVRDVAYGFSNSFLLDWKKPDNAANIIWDYLQIELLRCLEKKDPSHSQAQYAVSIFAVAPYICCQMAEKAQFHINHQEFLSLIKEAISFYTSNKNLLNQQILNICLECGSCSEIDLFQEIMVSEYSEILIKNVVLFEKQKSLDKEGKLDYTYSLVHQNFRDALATFYICSCLPKVRGRKEKTRLLEYADHYVKNYIAEFLSEDELVKIWNQHREEDSEDGHITYMLMDIIGRQRDYDFSELDFSYLDLTGTNLHSLLSRRTDICPLPSSRELFRKTKIAFSSICPRGYDPIVSIAFSPDGRRIASGVRGGKIHIHELRSGEMRILDNPFEGICLLYDVVFSSDSKNIACLLNSVEKSRVLIRNLSNGENIVLVGDSSSVLRSIKYCSNDNYLVGISDDKYIQIWDLNTKIHRVLNEDYFHTVAFNPKGNELALGLSDGLFIKTVEIYNLDNGDSCFLKDPHIKMTCIAFSPSGLNVAIGTIKGSLLIWNVKTKQYLELESNAGKVVSVAYSSDERTLVSELASGGIQIWDLNIYKSRIFEVQSGRIIHTTFSPDNRPLAIILDKGTVKIWDLNIDDSYELKGRRIESIVYSPNRNQLAGLSRNAIHIWDLDSGDSYELKGRNIESIVYSPNGNQLAGLSPNAVYIWDLENGTYCIIDASLGPINNISFSPNGNYLVCTPNDDTCRVINLVNGERRILSGHSGKINSISFSPGSDLLASGSDDQTVRIWNIESGESYPLDIHFPSVNCVSYSPDGKQLAIATDASDDIYIHKKTDSTLQIWDFDSRKIYPLENEEIDLSSPLGNQLLILYISDEKQAESDSTYQLASWSEEGTVLIWSLKRTGSHLSAINVFNLSEDSFLSLKHVVTPFIFTFNPENNKKQLAISSSSMYRDYSGSIGQIEIWDLNDLESGPRNIGVEELCDDTYDGTYTIKIDCMTFSPDGNQLAIGTENNQILILNLDNRIRNILWDTVEQYLGFGPNWHNIECISYSHDGRYLAAGSTDSTVRVFDLDIQPFRENELLSNELFTGTLSHEGRLFIGGYVDGTVRIWNLNSAENYLLYGISNSGTTQITFSPDNKNVALIINGHILKLLSLNNGKDFVFQFRESDIYFSDVVFSPDGKEIACACGYNNYSGIIQIFNIGSGERYVLEGHTDTNTNPALCVAYSPEGKQLACGLWDGSIIIWNLENGEQFILENHTAPISCLVYNPKGRQLAAGALDGSVFIWNIESGDNFILNQHSHNVLFLTFSPDGKRLSSGSRDGKVYITNLENGECHKLDIYNRIGNIHSLSYTSRGHLLASGSLDGTTRIYNLYSGEIVTLDDYTEISRRYIFLPYINLYGANFELAEITGFAREIFKKAGAKI